MGFNRREWLAAAGCLAGAGLLAGETKVAEPKTAPQFRYCLNTSTIRGQKLGIVKEVEIAAKAGYSAIEPWVRDLDVYASEGGSLKDLGKRISDAGLTVESAIGFAQWIVDDPQKRKQGLEQARKDMDALKQIGGLRLAAPPTGATNQSDLNLFEAARRYGDLLKIGDQIGVIPQVEVWGFSKSLSRLGESAFVAIESGHAQACLLPDVYHIYKGGSDFAGLTMFGPRGIHVFHINDYPANPPRETINDKDRIYPGDGIAPLSEIYRLLAGIGYVGVLSLELFNPRYWKQDALEVAKTGLEKMKTSVAKAFA